MKKQTPQKFNWMKYRRLYFVISSTLIAISVFSLVKWGLNLGVEFKGGVAVEYSLQKQIDTDVVQDKLAESGLEVSSVQSLEGSSVLIQFEQLDVDSRERLREEIVFLGGEGSVEVLYQNIGPTIGPELVKKTIYAIVIAAIVILAWVAYQFKNVIYGTSAILAMLHDTFVLLGSFSLLGHVYGAEIDFLFVTALLTTLSFSVHDTIVVYDRIREIRKSKAGSFVDIANSALSETMRRSINNSLTIIIMLVSLVVLGGATIKWFAIALLIGTVLGTYSSPFVAVPLLVTWVGFSRRKSL